MSKQQRYFLITFMAFLSFALIRPEHDELFYFFAFLAVKNGFAFVVWDKKP